MHDVGNGVSVPEGDWLVPLKGETSLTVELEMPGWSQADMVQVRGGGGGRGHGLWLYGAGM
jgi:hypothetical protein